LLYNLALTYRLIGFAPPPGSHALAHSPAEHRHGPRISHVHDSVPIRSTPQWTLDAILELNGEWHDFTRVAGARDANSGGNVVYLSPGVRVAYGNLSGFVSFGVPIVNDMNGLQSKPSYRVLTGLGLAY
jgi:hypothetical protein